MEVATSVLIHAPRAVVWKRITDIEHAPQTISGIEKVEILERPASGHRSFPGDSPRLLVGDAGHARCLDNEQVAGLITAGRRELLGEPDRWSRRAPHNAVPFCLSSRQSPPILHFRVASSW